MKKCNIDQLTPNVSNYTDTSFQVRSVEPFSIFQLVVLLWRGLHIGIFNCAWIIIQFKICLLRGGGCCFWCFLGSYWRQTKTCWWASGGWWDQPITSLDASSPICFGAASFSLKVNYLSSGKVNRRNWTLIIYPIFLAQAASSDIKKLIRFSCYQCLLRFTNETTREIIHRYLIKYLIIIHEYNVLSIERPVNMWFLYNTNQNIVCVEY